MHKREGGKGREGKGGREGGKEGGRGREGRKEGEGGREGGRGREGEREGGSEIERYAKYSTHVHYIKKEGSNNKGDKEKKRKRSTYFHVCSHFCCHPINK